MGFRVQKREQYPCGAVIDRVYGRPWWVWLLDPFNSGVLTNKQANKCPKHGYKRRLCRGSA